MANVKKPATLEIEDVFTQQVNANYKRCKEAREKAAKQRQEELKRMYRNSNRPCDNGVLCSYCDSMIGAFWDEINRVINTN